MGSSRQHRREERGVTWIGGILCLCAFAVLGHDPNGKGHSERGLSCYQGNFSTKPARGGSERRASSRECLNGPDGERGHS